jgi:hypothetical protein
MFLEPLETRDLLAQVTIDTHFTPGAEPSGYIEFRFMVMPPSPTPLTVNFSVSQSQDEEDGIAREGFDFEPINHFVTIPANQFQHILHIDVLDDQFYEPPSGETVTLTITPSPSYTIGPPGEAAAVIQAMSCRRRRWRCRAIASLW